MKTDNELRYAASKGASELVGQAVAERGVAPVEVEVGVEVAGDIQASLFEAGKRAAVRE